MEESTFLERLEAALPKLSQQQRKALIDAAAVAAYHAETGFPVVQALVCDDAPQFNWLSRERMLCWVHAGRLFKKLIPVVALHRELLAGFLKRFWEYYDQLLAYRQKPTAGRSLRLEIEFDRLFSTHTGYDELDQRITKTRQPRRPVCCWCSNTPNCHCITMQRNWGPGSEYASGMSVLVPRTQDGVRASGYLCDPAAATAKKLGVSFYRYLHDRISAENQIPLLADLVEKRAKNLNLGWSWAALLNPAPFY